MYFRFVDDVTMRDVDSKRQERNSRNYCIDSSQILLSGEDA